MHAYFWTADYLGIQPNRVDEVCTFNNPGSGTRYITLYGCNTYFSRVLTTITKEATHLKYLSPPMHRFLQGNLCCLL